MIQLSSLSNLHRNSNALFDMLLLFSLTIHHLLCIINYIIPNEAKKPLYKSNQTNVISQGLNQSSFLTLIIEHGRTSSLLNSSLRLPFSTTRFSRDSHVTRDDLTKAGFSLATEKPQQTVTSRQSTLVYHACTPLFQDCTLESQSTTLVRTASRILLADLDRRFARDTGDEPDEPSAKLFSRSVSELSRDAAARHGVTPETGDPPHNHDQADRCPTE